MTDPARTIERLAATERADPRGAFASPDAVVHVLDAPYESRLRVLQAWRARVAEEGDEAAQVAVSDAIRALEQGVALGEDAPSEPPEGWGYGGAEYSGRRDED